MSSTTKSSVPSAPLSGRVVSRRQGNASTRIADGAIQMTASKRGRAWRARAGSNDSSSVTGGGSDHQPQHLNSRKASSALSASVAMDLEDQQQQGYLNGTSGSGHDLASYAPMEIELSNQQQELEGSGFYMLQRRIWHWIAILDDPTLPVGRFLVIFASAIYGTNFATVKLLDDAMPLSISASLRFGLAASVVAATVFSQESDDVDGMEVKDRNVAFWAGGEVGLWYSIGYIAQAEGLQTVAAGKSAFFNSLAVVIVPLLDMLFKGKLMRSQQMLSVLLACIGVGFLELGPTGDINVTPGDLMAFAQTIFFGIGYWRLEAVSHTFPRQAERVTVGLLSSVAMGSCVFALTELLLGHLEASPEQLVGWLGDPFIILALCWTGLVSTALALYLETVALKVVSATELTLIMTSVSLWGAAFAYVTIGERLSGVGMIGGILIMAGCVLGSTGPRNNKSVALSTKADNEELNP